MNLVLYRAEMAAKMQDDGEEDAIAESRSPSPDELMELKEMDQMVRWPLEYLERSKNPKAKLIRHHYFEGASYKQLVEKEHITCSAMRTRVSRAVRSLTWEVVLKPLDAPEIRSNR